MNKLNEIIANRIKSNGPMRFRDFMQSALFEPSLGYYTRANLEIGKSGDFYTSPHSHAVFGHTIGRQVEQCFNALGGADSFKDEPFNIIECGGGRGWLAKDILDSLKDTHVYDCITYTLLELNPSMADRQQTLLEAHADHLNWATSFDETKGIRGMIISNELIDAFAVHLIEYASKWNEIFISLEGDDFIETLKPIEDPRLLDYIDKYIGKEIPDGYHTEINLHASEWLTTAASTLSAGYVLTIDYGYPCEELYAPERNRGTLICYREHDTNEDYLSHIGKQDITAHVNFTDLKSTGDTLGLSTVGFARQGIYLVSLGIDKSITKYFGAGNSVGRDMHKINNLIMPGTMGDTHKVLLQSKGVNSSTAMSGFEMKNEIHKLD